MSFPHNETLKLLRFAHEEASRMKRAGKIEEALEVLRAASALDNMEEHQGILKLRIQILEDSLYEISELNSWYERSSRAPS